MLHPHEDHCYCHRSDAPLKQENKAAYATISVPDLSWQHGDSLLSLVGNTLIALILLVGRQEGHPAYKVLSQQFPRVYIREPA